MEEKIVGDEMIKKLRGQGVGWIVYMKFKVFENENKFGKEDSKFFVKIISD